MKKLNELKIILNAGLADLDNRDHFKQAVGLALFTGLFTTEQLCKRFGCGRTQVSRWVSGSDCPHRFAVKTIYMRLKLKLEQREGDDKSE